MAARKTLLRSLVVLATLNGSPAGLMPAPAASKPTPAGSCPVGPEATCVLNLRGSAVPTIPPGCLSKPWASFLGFEQPGSMSNADNDLWWETVLRLNLDPAGGCGCAVFRIFYDKSPTGFTVDVGDSPTNDGWGGDAGTTPRAAEVQVKEGTLSVFSDASRTRVDQILGLDLPDLKGRVLSLRVCDQSLRFEVEKGGAGQSPLVGKMSSATFLHLFALGGQAVTGAREGARRVDYGIWAAFNRVIHVRDGAAARGRLGAGAGRVEIYLTP